MSDLQFSCPALTEATVAFVDIKGFTRLCESVGAERAYFAVTGCLRLLDGIARRHGGAVDKYLGDSLMVVFGHPVPRPDAPRAALAAALEMRREVREYDRSLPFEESLEVVIGVNTGPMVAGDVRGAVVREFHVLGDAVNVAARIKAKAPLGAIYVGPATWAAAAEAFEFRSVGTLPLKGKRAAVEIHELVRSSQERWRSGLERHLSGSVPFVGREKERSALDAWLDELCAGRGGVLTLAGAPGSGRSRLLAEAVAGRDLSVLELAAPEQPGALATDLALALDTKRRPATAGAAFACVEAWARQAPALLVLDGAEQLAAEDAQALPRLFEIARERPLGICLVTPLELPEPLRKALDTLSSGPADAAREVRLEPLSAEAGRELAELLARDGGDAAEVLRVVEQRGGGNPRQLILATHLAPALRAQESQGTQETRSRFDETERRRATILFADITGFTAMTERLGAERAYPQVVGCLQILDEVARKYGGTVEKYLGDCVMALFGVPEALEDAPRAAVNAAIEMRRRVREYSARLEEGVSFDVHTGIHTGLGIAGDISGPLIRESAVMGDPVDVAEALTDLAPPGCVFVGEEVQRFTREVFEYQEREAISLKGRSGSFSVFELLSDREHLHRAQVGRERQVFSSLVGRETELASLRDRLRRLHAGQGGVVALVAEAGLGKSRLIAELEASEEAQGATWLLGRSLSTGRRLSFHPFADLLRAWARIDDSDDDVSSRLKLEAALARWLPDDDPGQIVPFVTRVMGLKAEAAEQARLDAMPGDALEKRVQHAVGQLLAAGSRHEPIVVVMDDLHWADLSSIELLTTLIRLCRDHPLLFLLVCRPGFSETSGRVQEVALVELAEESHEILLEPLDDRAARALLNNLFPPGELPRTTRRLIEEKARGNPFYIEEVVRALVDAGAVEARDGTFHATDRIDRFEIPGSVQEVVQSRVDRLEQGRRRLLQTAAVIGQSFHLDVLADVAAGEARISEDLEWLMDAEFLVPSDRLPGEEYAFKHPLIHEVTYDGLLQTRREELHREIGGAIERRLDAEVPGFHGMLAYHFGLGKDLERAEAYLLQAGTDAARAAASNEALHFFQEASRLYLEHYGDAADPARCATLEKNVASALYYRGRFVEAIEHYDQALALLGDPPIRSTWGQRLRFALDLGGVLLRLYLPVLRGRGQASEHEREIMATRYQRAEATVYAMPERHVFDGLRTLARLQRVDPHSVPDAARMYAGAVALFAFAGILFDASRRLATIALSLVDGDDVSQQTYVRVMSFIYHFMKGDWRDAHEIAPELIDASLSQGELWGPVIYLDLLALKCLQQGNWEGLRACRERTAEVWDLFQYDGAKTSLYQIKATVALEREHADEARRAADAYFDETSEELLHIVALGTRAKSEVQLGDLDTAGRTLTEAEALTAKCAPVPPFHASFYLRSRLLFDVSRLQAALDAGDRDGAIAARRAAARSARMALRNAARVSLARSEILQLAARAAWLSGRRRTAWRLYERSARAAELQALRPATRRLFAEVVQRLRSEGRRRRFLGHDAEACKAIAGGHFSGQVAGSPR